MSSFIDEIMGFNPEDLTVFNEPVNNNYSSNIYKTNPAMSKAEDGHYRSKLRLIYNPFNPKDSIVPQASYAMSDTNGFFMVKSKLGNGDKDCPIFKSWKALWFSNDEKKKNWAKSMYDKSESQWCLVQILEDDNQPELVGQIKVMKLPRVVGEKLTAKMHPSAESKKQPVAVMDYLFGLPLEMDVTPGPDDPQNPQRKQREISYSLCEFDADYEPIIKTDGTPLFDEHEMELIDLFATAKADAIKAKTQAKRDEKLKVVEENKVAIRELYAKAIEYVKANAIDLRDECGYKEWDEETKQRVENWITVVANMKDPKSVTVQQLQQASAAPAAPAAPVSPTTPQQAPAAPQSAPATDMATSMIDDDMPF